MRLTETSPGISQVLILCIKSISLVATVLLKKWEIGDSSPSERHRCARPIGRAYRPTDLQTRGSSCSRSQLVFSVLSTRADGSSKAGNQVLSFSFETVWVANASDFSFLRVSQDRSDAAARYQFCWQLLRDLSPLHKYRVRAYGCYELELRSVADLPVFLFVLAVEPRSNFS